MLGFVLFALAVGVWAFWFRELLRQSRDRSDN